MIKNPISKTGHIRYFELFKFVFVLFLFLASITYFIEHLEHMVNMVYIVLITEYIVILSLLLLIFNDIKILLQLIQSVRVYIRQYQIKYKIKKLIITNQVIIIQYKNNIFKENNVLLC